MNNSGKCAFLCLTHNNIDNFERCLLQYEEQTYSNKVLIIVADGLDYVRSVKRVLEKHKSNAHLLSEHSGMCLGCYRNVSIKKAKELGCEFVATFDDDDKNATTRIANEIEFLTTNKFKMVMLSNYTIVLNPKTIIPITNNGGKCNTMVALTDCVCDVGYNDFFRIHEDSEMIKRFSEKFGRESIGIQSASFDLYTYIFNGQNISGYNHFLDIAVKEKAII